MILEGIVTTVNVDGTANISPMGPLVDRELTRLVLRPYKTSRTYANLKRDRRGVLHVTDDVLLMARAAVGKFDPPPKLLRHKTRGGFILADCCRWYAFNVTKLFDESDRTTIECEIIDRGSVREFFGFNRAKHAVLEAAILATRLHILPAQQVREELQRLSTPVDKTAGDQERQAFDFLRKHIEDRIASAID